MKMGAAARGVRRPACVLRSGLTPSPPTQWEECEEMQGMITACVVLYLVLLLGLLVACLLRRIGWRWLLAAAIPLFVAAAVVCLGVLLVALLSRGKGRERVESRERPATELPWRYHVASAGRSDGSADSSQYGLRSRLRELR